MQIEVGQMLKTHKLNKQAEQPISCAEGENLTKNRNFEHESTSWVFHVGSWRNMFGVNMRCISWDLDEHVWMQSIVGELVSWSSMKEKFLKFGEKMLRVEKTSESGWEVWVFILRKVFSLEKLGWNGKTWKIKAKSSFV
jgi:hypothetical protein